VPQLYITTNMVVIVHVVDDVSNYRRKQKLKLKRF